MDLSLLVERRGCLLCERRLCVVNLMVGKDRLVRRNGVPRFGGRGSWHECYVGEIYSRLAL